MDTLRYGLAVLVVLSVACSSGDQKRSWKGKKKDSVTVVEVQEVGTGSVAGLLLANAVVESEAQASILPTAGGVVLSVHKDEGDLVKRGDLLAVLENVALDANAERASAERGRLEQQVARTRELFSQGVVSRRELEDLEHQLRTARTSDREASSTFGETRLVAPFDGVVASRDVRVGEYAGASVVAFQVVDLGALRVVASLPERDLSKVQLGQMAKLVSAYDDSVWTTGEVSRIAPIVDSSSGTFRVTLTLEPDQKVLRPGQFVSVELEVERRNDVLVVPRKSIVYEDGRAVVYLMVPAPPPAEEEKGEEAEAEGESWFAKLPWSKTSEDEDTTDSESAKAGDSSSEEKFVAERRAIERGLVDRDLVEILSGVGEGDQVVVLGQSNLRDGARIRTPEMIVAENDSEEGSDAEEHEEAE